MNVLETADKAAGWFVAGVFTVSTVASTYDSYTGLRTWALEHGDTSLKADLFPLFIDAFALGAEAFMFRAALRGWGFGPKFVGWVVAGAGLALSIALNVGQYRSTDWLTQGTQGIAPLAAFFSLLVGSIMFEQSMKAAKKQETVVAVAPVALPVPLPAVEDTVPDVPAVDDDTESVDSVDALDEADEPEVEVEVEEPEVEVEVEEPEVEVSPEQAELLELFARAEAVFADDIAKGHKTGIGRIKREFSQGIAKIVKIQGHLHTVVDERARELTPALYRS